MVSSLNPDVILKPTMLAVTVAVRLRGPMVPAMVTANAPGLDPVRVQVELAELPSVRLAGLHETEGAPGRVVASSDMVPVNPLMLVAVTFALAVPPGLKVTLVGLAVSE